MLHHKINDDTFYVGADRGVRVPLELKIAEETLGHNKTSDDDSDPKWGKPRQNHLGDEVWRREVGTSRCMDGYPPSYWMIAAEICQKILS